MTSFLALCEAVLFKETRREACGAMARRLLLTEDNYAFRPPRPNNALFGAASAATAAGILKVFGVLSEEDLDLLAERTIPRLVDVNRQFLKRPPPRVSNHAMLSMAGSQYFADLFPDHPDAPMLREQAGVLWEDFWRIRDNPEVSSLYEPFSFMSHIQYAEATDRRDAYYNDPSIRAMFDRALQTLTPAGPMVSYCDASWSASWGPWSAVFDKGAAVYRDGRYAWAADHIRQYAARHKMWDWPREIDRQPVASAEAAQGLVSNYLIEIHGLAYACLWQDPAVVSEEPTSGCAILCRTTPSDTQPPAAGPREQERVVLRGGWRSAAPFLAVPLMRRLMGHHQHDAGAIGMLMAGGAALLSQTGYFWKDPRFHNLLFARPADEAFLAPYGKGSPAPESPGYTVDGIEEDGDAARFVATCERLHGYPIAHAREIILNLGSGACRVQDTVRVQEGHYRIAPLYHTERIVASGPGWCDTAHEHVYRALGITLPNAPMHLVVRFPEVSERLEPFAPQLRDDHFSSYNVPDWIRMYLSWRVQHTCVFHSVLVRAGETHRIVSELIPHAPDRFPL